VLSIVKFYFFSSQRLSFLIRKVLIPGREVPAWVVRPVGSTTLQDLCIPPIPTVDANSCGLYCQCRYTSLETGCSQRMTEPSHLELPFSPRRCLQQGFRVAVAHCSRSLYLLRCIYSNLQRLLTKAIPPFLLGPLRSPCSLTPVQAIALA
jgi:hypothetical protein